MYFIKASLFSSKFYRYCIFKIKNIKASEESPGSFCGIQLNYVTSLGTACLCACVTHGFPVEAKKVAQYLTTKLENYGVR